jgi:hypothetical protein
MRRLAALWALIGLLAACAAPSESVVAPAAPTTSTPPTLDDLPLGPPPRIGYVVDHRFVGPGGRRHALPRRHRILSVARLGDGFLVQDDRAFEGYTGLALVRRGRNVEGWSTPGSPVLGRGGAVAWSEATTSEASVQPPPMVRLEVDGVRLQQRVDLHPVLAGIIGEEVIVNAMFAPYPNSPGAVATDLVSPPRELGVGYVADVDEVHKRILGQRGRGRPVVMDFATLDRLWDPSGRRSWLTSFNPTGNLVLAKISARSWEVVESDSGKTRGRVELPRGMRAHQVVWENPRTLLMVVAHASQTAIVRAYLSGRLEIVTPALQRLRFGPAPYVLTERP